MRTGRLVASSNTPPNEAGQEFTIHAVQMEMAMANDLISSENQAVGHLGLAWLARNPSRWTTDGAMVVAGDRPLDTIAEALARLASDLSPVPTDEAARASWNSAMDERLRRLAVKVQPGMSPDQSQPWRDVMVDALSDLPALVALTAAKRALHRPMKFMNEIEGVVREIAEEVEAGRRAAIARLKHLADEIARAANRQPALVAPDVDEPISAEEIRAMLPSLVAIGLKQGWITQDQVDAARADTQEAKAA